MGETLGKVSIASKGPVDGMPPAYNGESGKPPGSSHLLRIGAVALAVGAVLILAGTVGTLLLWRFGHKQVYNVNYSMVINGKTEEASMEIGAGNNIERFRTVSEDRKATEVHDFRAGITGIRFSEGRKCYIKTQTKANLPELGKRLKESITLDLEEDMLPVQPHDESLVWMSSDEPVKDSSVLAPTILDLCGDLPIFWLRSVYRKGSDKEEVARKRRDTEEDKEMNGEASAGEIQPANNEDDGSGSALNPENPYHRGQDQEAGNMVFDPMLDHLGICCTECRRSYTHCERICEPLGGYWPWPYNYRGCRVACRLILPCRWWVGRILGLV